MAISKLAFRTKKPLQVNGKTDKKCIFCAEFALRKKFGSIPFSQFYIFQNLAKNLHINVKKLGVTVLVFPEKRKIDQKIVIFVLLRAIVSQKRKNAIASVQSPLAIDAYLDEKFSPCERLRSVCSA